MDCSDIECKLAVADEESSRVASIAAREHIAEAERSRVLMLRDSEMSVQASLVNLVLMLSILIGFHTSTSLLAGRPLNSGRGS